jgi:hypothetical protein
MCGPENSITQEPFTPAFEWLAVVIRQLSAGQGVDNSISEQRLSIRNGTFVQVSRADDDPHAKNPPKAFRNGRAFRYRGSEAMRVAELPAADPLTGGLAITGHLLLAPRVTDLIRNAGLR